MKQTGVVLIALDDEFSGVDGTQLATKGKEYPVYQTPNNSCKIYYDDGDTITVGGIYSDGMFWGTYIIGILFKVKEGTNNGQEQRC